MARGQGRVPTPRYHQLVEQNKAMEAAGLLLLLRGRWCALHMLLHARLVTGFDLLQLGLLI